MCVGPLLALAWPLQMDIVALESTRRSTAREQLFSVLCDCRLQRALGSAGGGSAALRRDARGTCSSALRRGVRAAGVSLPNAAQLVAPRFRLRVPAADYAANDVAYCDA